MMLTRSAAAVAVTLLAVALAVAAGGGDDAGKGRFRDTFSVDKAANDVYYFGEDVDMYDKDGKVTGHEGSWLAGVKGARFGLMMPGAPKVGDKYYQEVAPGTALDRAEVVSLDETVKVPAGEFKNVLRTRESSGLEKGSEDKLYAPGVGQIKDAGFVLAKISKPKP